MLFNRLVSNKTGKFCGCLNLTWFFEGENKKKNWNFKFITLINYVHGVKV